MENRSSKIVAIVALCVGVVGLSLGFAAFSNTLTISSSAEVAPDASTFNVDVAYTAAEGTNPLLAGGNFTVGTPSVDNTNDPVISGLSAIFTEPGQSVTYSFTVENAGELAAYLKSINFAKVDYETSTGTTEKRHATCTPAAVTVGDNTVQAADATLVKKACDGMLVTVTVGSATANSRTASLPVAVSNHLLDVDGEETLTVKLEYEAGSERVDGGMTVAFGDITLGYSSVD